MTNPYIKAAGYVISNDQIGAFETFLQGLDDDDFGQAKRILGATSLNFNASIARISVPDTEIGKGMNTNCTQSEYDELKAIKNLIPPGDLRDRMDWGQMPSLSRPDLMPYSEWLATLSPPVQITEEP